MADTDRPAGEKDHVDNRVPCPDCGGAGKVAGTVPGVPAAVCTRLSICQRCWPRDEKGEPLFWNDGTAGTIIASRERGR